MASLYPAQLDNFATNRTNATPNNPVQRDDHNDHADAINKMQAEIGVDPSGFAATIRARLDAMMLAAPSAAGQIGVWDSGLARNVFKKITDAEIDAAAAIAVTKLAPGSVGQVLMTNAGPSIGWGSVVAIPAGVIMPFAGPSGSVPAGFLICQGQEVSRSTYSTLFGILGIVYGAGNGSTTFNLPDFRGRVPVGLGQHADVDTLGENDVIPVANRTPVHNTTVTTSPHSHGVTDPGHFHSYNGATREFYFGGSSSSINDAAGGNTGSKTTGISIQNATVTASGGPGGTRPADVVPYQIVNYIIKT